MVWDPRRIVPARWATVVEFYRHLEERNDQYRPLRSLAHHVGSQPYASSLFAATSGTSLLAVHQADSDWARQAVRIDVNLAGSIRFTRPEMRRVRPQTFDCDPKRIVDVFEGYLRDSGWVLPPPPK